MDRALHAARSSTPARSGWDPPLHGKSRTLAKTKQETLQLQEKRSRTSNKLKKEECGAEQSGVGPLPSLSGEPGPHACLSVCLSVEHSFPEGPRRFTGTPGFPGFPWTRSKGGGWGEGWRSPGTAAPSAAAHPCEMG